jgi:hypothetical protein
VYVRRDLATHSFDVGACRCRKKIAMRVDFTRESPRECFARAARARFVVGARPRSASSRRTSRVCRPSDA